jgi:hypothetical protein
MRSSSEERRLAEEAEFERLVDEIERLARLQAIVELEITVSERSSDPSSRNGDQPSNPIKED